MFRLNHILTPSNWPHAGMVCCCALPCKCRSQGGCCLWAQVPLWWLWHLSPALTLALRGLVASAKKLQATVPQGWCSHPTGSHHWHVNPSSSSSLRQPGAAQWHSVLGCSRAWFCVGLVQVSTSYCEFTITELQKGPYSMCLLLDHCPSPSVPKEMT